MERPTNTLENIHHFPKTKQIHPVDYFVNNEENENPLPFPEGHLQFEPPKGAKWYYTKLDGKFLRGQFEKPSVKRGDRNVTPLRFHHLICGKSKAYKWYQHWWVFSCGFCKKEFLGRRDRYVNGGLKSCGCIALVSSPRGQKTSKVGAETYLINKAKPNETVEMFTGNALKREGLVLVTVQDAQLIWSGTETLEGIIEKKKQLGPKYFEYKDPNLDSRRVNREEKRYMWSHNGKVPR